MNDPAWPASRSLQQSYFDRYAAELRASHPDRSESYLRSRARRSPSPPELGPHVAGAAVDLTLCTTAGAELDLGTPVDASPEESDGACRTSAADITATARRRSRRPGPLSLVAVSGRRAWGRRGGP